MIERLQEAVDKGIYEEIVYPSLLAVIFLAVKDSKFRVLLQLKAAGNYIIEQSMIDRNYGDEYANGLDIESKIKTALKGHIWKGTYHVPVDDELRKQVKRQRLNFLCRFRQGAVGIRSLWMF